MKYKSWQLKCKRWRRIRTNQNKLKQKPLMIKDLRLNPGLSLLSYLISGCLGILCTEGENSRTNHRPSNNPPPKLLMRSLTAQMVCGHQISPDSSQIKGLNQGPQTQIKPTNQFHIYYPGVSAQKIGSRSIVIFKRSESEGVYNCT